MIDEVRRHGTKRILLSDRSAAELRRDSTDLLRHFDRVVARQNRREALLEVLQELDVDLHDALRVSGDARDADMLGALEVSVVVTDPDRAASDRSTGRQIEAGIEAGQVRTGRSTMSRPTLSRRPDLRGTDYQLAGPGPSVLDRVLHEIQAGRPALSPPRHNVQVRIERADGAVTVAVPGAHANVLICAGEPMTAGIPVRLVAQ